MMIDEGRWLGVPHVSQEGSTKRPSVPRSRWQLELTLKLLPVLPNSRKVIFIHEWLLKQVFLLGYAMRGHTAYSTILLMSTQISSPKRHREKDIEFSNLFSRVSNESGIR